MLVRQLGIETLLRQYHMQVVLVGVVVTEALYELMSLADFGLLVNEFGPVLL